jgi:hypothetical protein
MQFRILRLDASRHLSLIIELETLCEMLLRDAIVNPLDSKVASPLATEFVAHQQAAQLMASETCAPTDSRNYKRVQCRHFAAGMCVRGATCGFKHGEHDTGDSLQAMVLPPMVPMISHLNADKPFRVVPCQHWLAGNCRKGEFCTFRHEFPAVNPTVSSSSSTQ